MKKVVYVILLMIFSVKSFATPILLDFSSGTYNQSNKMYMEDGFNITANYGFHNIRLDTLAWDETSNTIEVSKSDGFFDLDKLTVVNTAFMGLTFESSKGGKVSIGGIKGVLNFSGEEWHGIKSFTIKTILNNNDILNQIDNIYLNDLPVNVPEPSSLFLLLAPLLLVLYMHNKSFQPRHFVAVHFLSRSFMVLLRKIIP
jgi:hypothetical protein